jgi:hypothetical protein
MVNLVPLNAKSTSYKKSLFSLSILFLALFSLISCDGDYRKAARGSLGHIIVLTDTTGFAELNSLNMSGVDTDKFSGAQNLHYALIEVFEQGLYASPGFESAYLPRYVSFQSAQDLEELKRARNLIIATPLEDTSAAGQFLNALLDPEVKKAISSGQLNYIPLYNKWYKDQLTILITAPTYNELAEYLVANKEVLLKDLDKIELERTTYEVYKKQEQTALSDSLWTEYGFKLRVQHDYNWNVDTTQFISFRRYMPENDRWFWVHWLENVEDPDYVNQQWINSQRDAILEQYIRGTSDNSYVQTEYERPIKYEEFTYNGKPAYSVEGTWKMINGAMGGGFVHQTVYDANQKRLYMIEYMVFAPNFKKRPFVRQFQAMINTFETNPEYKPNFRPESD